MTPFDLDVRDADFRKSGKFMSKREPKLTKREQAAQAKALSKLTRATFRNYDASLEGVCAWARAEHAAGRKLEHRLAMVNAKKTPVTVIFGDHDAGARVFADAGLNEVTTHLAQPAAPDTLRVLVSDADGERCLKITLSDLLEKNDGR